MAQILCILDEDTGERITFNIFFAVGLKGFDRVDKLEVKSYYASAGASDAELGRLFISAILFAAQEVADIAGLIYAENATRDKDES